MIRAPSGASARVMNMNPTSHCACAKPILREISEQKGSSVSFCDRCKRPIGLRIASVRSAA
jgi:hypothetical protein